MLIALPGAPAAFADEKDGGVKPKPRPRYLLETREYAERRRFNGRMKQRRETFLSTLRYHKENALAAIRRCDRALYDGTRAARNGAEEEMRRWRRSQVTKYTVLIVKLKARESTLKEKYDALTKELENFPIFKRLTSDKYRKLQQSTEDAQIEWENARTDLSVAQFKRDHLHDVIWLLLFFEEKLPRFPKNCTVVRLEKPTVPGVLDTKGTGKLFKFPVTRKHLRECGYVTRQSLKLAFRDPKGLGTRGWQWLGVATPCPSLKRGLVVDFQKVCRAYNKPLLVRHPDGVPICVKDPRHIQTKLTASMAGLVGTTPMTFLCRAAYYNELGSATRTSKTNTNPDKIVAIMKYILGRQNMECFFIKTGQWKILHAKDPK